MQPSEELMGASLDREFVRWVHKAALVLLLVFVLPAGLYGKEAVLGYALGGVISIGLLWSHQWLVARVFERGARGVRGALMALWFLKYPVLVVVLYFAVTHEAVSVVGLCVGLGLVPFAITIKVLGGVLRGGADSGRRQ